eukprot:TRINITY_DN15286_c0_g1_i1.p2 TRINITY_DN15286_c0_g1~~TRINITY_DN15286_c0_g1_i1.p2  ORF type:complete len:142 (+),score=30.66 TRINITY_DN15286_c0_g1_i1:45-428(+)
MNAKAVDAQPEYSKVVHDAIVNGPPAFYFDMDNSYHRKIVYEICDHYGYRYKKETVKSVIRALSEEQQKELGEPYHGPGCEDCGGNYVNIKRIIIRKLPQYLKKVAPMTFITSTTNAFQAPVPHPIP